MTTSTEEAEARSALADAQAVDVLFVRCLPVRVVAELLDAIVRLRGAIADHHGQRADDRCWMDDDALYAAAGLPPCDRRVGDKTAMLANCRRFLDVRCEGGHWPTYAELEAEVERLRQLHAGACERIAQQSELLSRRAEVKPREQTE